MLGGKKMLDRYYSGVESHGFWQLVRIVRKSCPKLYELGCNLQDQEEGVLHLLEKEIYAPAKKKAARKLKSTNKRKLAPVQAQSRKCRKTSTLAC